MRWMFIFAFTAMLQCFAADVDTSKLPPPAANADFDKDIRPILEASCVGCHGGAKPKSALSVESRALLLKGGKEGAAIVPGSSEKSPLIHFVAALVDEMEMPPKGKGAPLTREQIAVLRTWIDQGLKWPDGVKLIRKESSDDKPSALTPDVEQKKTAPKVNRNHWAFKAPVKPALPTTGFYPSITPLDTFVFSRLEKERLKPSPESDKVTQIRRLSLDLIGLPPSIEEVDAFVADNSSNAYYFLVERLLASPHYGERWGRHWLDAARYADSDGFEKDKPRFAWAYRDWVINALNKNLPYDQFVIEQIAGDQLPGAAQDDIVATGYLRNSMINEEGGVHPEQFRMEAMFDRMDCIGRGVLGLSVACCQCHDHKFDPFTQAEYYKLFAFLNNDHEACAAVYTADQLMKKSALMRDIAGIESDLQHKNSDWSERLAAWESAAKKDQPVWTVLKPEVDDISTDGQRYLPQPDGSLYACGYAPTKHNAKFSAKFNAKKIAAFRLELLTDPNLPLNGPGRSFRGTGALTEFEVETTLNGKTQKLKFSNASADYGDAPDTPLEKNFYDKTDKKRITGPIAYAIDGKEETAWGFDQGPVRRNQPRKAVFNLEKPLGDENVSADITLVFYLKQNHGGWNSDDLMTNNLGRIRLSYTSAPDAQADPLPKDVRDALGLAREKRSPAQSAAIFSYWRATVPEWKDANEQIEALWKQHPNPATQLVLQTRETPRDTFMLKRGDQFKPLDKVGAGVPAFMHQLPTNAPPTRLTFARWLVDKKSPTTARAFVNRVWQAYFGTGLVSTSEDLGSQCEAPSHPELLDWLACEFMERNWDIKALHRLIVNSAAYKQSSHVTPELYSKDPYNRLLARGARFRVEGEIVHDIALSAAGVLNLKMGGRGIMPPAPAFLFVAPASYAPFPWIDESGDEKYRRAVYIYRRRTTPYPFLTTFDTPEGNTSCIRRARSNTPLQALMTLNETLSMNAAQLLARKTLAEGGATDSERITYAFRRTLSRKPDDAELRTLENTLNRQRERLKDGKLNALEIAAGKDAKTDALPKSIDAKEAAAFTIVARVLLNLDETITRE